MIPIYVFDDKYAGDTDGFTFNLAAWLGDEDALAGTPAVTVTPTGVTITDIVVAGSLVTIWISGGTATITYTIDLTTVTTAGRDCHIRGTFMVEA